MGFDLQTSVSAITVFFQGLLSFLSPCVLPLVPLYLSYLAGGAVDALDAQARRRTLRNTLFFILGISFAFFVLGLGFTALGRFFSGNRALFARIGGILIILMGLWQLFGAGFSKELRLPVRLALSSNRNTKTSRHVRNVKGGFRYGNRKSGKYGNVRRGCRRRSLPDRTERDRPGLRPGRPA